MSLLLSSAKGRLKRFLENLPSRRQCQKFFEVLSKEEKKYFLAFLVLFAASLVFLSLDFYFKGTEIKPAFGGTFSEGVLGQPRFINPILAAVNDVDRDLTELVFAGLMKYSSQGEIVPDLVETYEIRENDKIWDLTLKKDLVFQDGSSLTADDVIFTIKTIQNPDYKSPLRANWLGIEVERISDLRIRFKLKNSYPAFLETLTLKIMPKKVWEGISPDNFPLAIFNLKPVGSGPYRVAEILQEKSETGRIKSLALDVNPKYYGKIPNIKEIIFVFFEEEKDLAKAAKSKEIQAFILPSLKDKDLLEKKGFLSHAFSLPRYFAVFFNQKSFPPLADKNIRTALNYATNKREIINEVLFGNGRITDSPLLPALFNFAEPKTIFKFSLKKANDILDKTGFKLDPQTQIRQKTVDRKPSFQFKSNLSKGSQGVEVKELQKCLARDSEVYPEGEVTGVFGDKTKQAVIKFQEKYRQEVLAPSNLENGNGEVGLVTRKKLNDWCFGPSQETLQLKFSLLTVDDPTLLKAAEILKNQWAKAGISLDIKSFSFSQLSSEFLKSRNYNSLLFGEVLGLTLDLFPFWHSSQEKDPGLNLALYKNQGADKLLEQARQTFDEDLRKQKLEEFQEILLKDAPAVFLYQPDFLYIALPKINGIKAGIIADPSKRFVDVENWHIKIKRAWK
ncbi:MAG: ABC transporter substrate-binding protein [bacterium]|nr:ABC transporter substrate-binding protein [bacterium]